MHNSFKHRWIYRFDNFKRAFALFEEVVNLCNKRTQNNTARTRGYYSAF